MSDIVSKTGADGAATDGAATQKAATQKAAADLENEILGLAPFAVIACDEQQIVRLANPKAVQWLATELGAFDAESPIGLDLGAVFPDLNFGCDDLSDSANTVSIAVNSLRLQLHVVPLEYRGQAWTIVYFQPANKRELLLEREASTDELSGLANRRAFQRTMEAKAHLPLSLAIVDIDNFKSINDRHGHVVGDDALRLTSDLLKEFFEDKAILVSRMGGDEFSVLFETAEPDLILASLNQFREKVSRSRTDSGGDLGVTVSIGAVLSQSPGTGARTLLTVADQQLYKAKAAGRNQVFSVFHP